MAESSAAAWLSTHPDGLRATFSPSVGALRSLPDHPGSNMQFSSTDLLSTPEGGAEAIATWQFNLGFHPPISRTSSLDEARAHFAWVALDRYVWMRDELERVPQGWVYPSMRTGSLAHNHPLRIIPAAGSMSSSTCVHPIC